jgi:hypothetical protein
MGALLRCYMILRLLIWQWQDQWTDRRLGGVYFRRSRRLSWASGRRKCFDDHGSCRPRLLQRFVEINGKTLTMLTRAQLRLS